MALKHVGGGKFVDEDPVDVKDAAPREWFPGLERFKVYPWVEFYSLERAGYGLLATEGAHDAEVVATYETGEQIFDPTAVASLMEFKEALEAIEEGARYSLEEFPYSEITQEEDYNRVLAACLGQEVTPPSSKDWSPRGEPGPKKETSLWTGPGVYDMRDCPPSRSYESVEEFEISSMEYWADDTLEFMFQDDAWRYTLTKLLDDLKDR